MWTKNRQLVGFPPKQNKLKDLILEADNDKAVQVHNSEYIQSTGWLNFSSCSATQHTESTVIYFIYQQSTALLILSKCWIGNSLFCSFWGQEITRLNPRHIVRTDFRHPFWHKDISLPQSDNDTSRKSKHVTVIPRLTKIIRSGITFVSRNVISRRFYQASHCSLSQT